MMYRKICMITMLCWTQMVVVAQEKLGEGVQFRDNVAWKKVVEEAVQANKMIFVDCYTSWCGPCQRLAKTVFPKKEVGDFFNASFVNVKYDMEKNEGVHFGKLYNGVVDAYPTMLVIDPRSGKIEHKFVGVRSPNELIFEAKQGLTGRGLTALEASYCKGERNYNLIKDYVLSLSLAGADDKVVKVIDAYFRENDSLQNLLNNEDYWKFFSNYLIDIHSDFVQYVIKNFVSFSFKSFVDREALKEILSKRILDGIDQLLDMHWDKRKMIHFIPNLEFRDTLKQNVKDIAFFPKREECVAQLKLYDRLIAEDWEKAFEILSYMQEFEFKPEIRKHYLPVSLYIVKNTEDKKLLLNVLVGLKDFQLMQEKVSPNFNIYDSIALVQEKLGEKDAAKLSKEKYRELCEKRKKQFKVRR